MQDSLQDSLKMILNGMTNTNNKDEVIEITPEQSEKINEILKVFSEMLVKHSSASRDDKAMGGFVDKTITQPNTDKIIEIINLSRRKMEEGGFVDDFPTDEEGQLKYFISLLSPPTDSYQAYLLEQMEQDLARMIKTRAK